MNGEGLRTPDMSTGIVFRVCEVLCCDPSNRHSGLVVCD